MKLNKSRIIPLLCILGVFKGDMISDVVINITCSYDSLFPICLGFKERECEHYIDLVIPLQYQLTTLSKIKKYRNIKCKIKQCRSIQIKPWIDVIWYKDAKSSWSTCITLSALFSHCKSVIANKQ